MNTMLAKEFLSTGKFAVGKAVGASSSREKYGNRVLRWYMDRSLPVTPVNPQTREETIEGISVVKSLSDLPGASETAVSVITPPSASLAVLKEASSLGVPYIWIQPGAEDAAVREYIESSDLGSRVLYGGPCILRDGPGLLSKL